MRVLALVLLGSVSALRTSTTNPIRPIINVLESVISKNSDAVDEKEKIFADFQCDYKKGLAAEQENLAAMQNDAKTQKGTFDQKSGEADGASGKVAAAKAKRDDRRKALVELNAQREQDSKAYAQSSTENNANVKAMENAIKRLSGKSFLSVPDTTNALAMIQGVEDQKQSILSLVSTSTGSVDQVVGMLKEMFENLSEDIANADEAEKVARNAYQEQVRLMNEEVAAATVSIESNLEKGGAARLAAAAAKNKMNSARDAAAESTEKIAELNGEFKERSAEHTRTVAEINAEKKAVTEAKNYLSSDEALEAFKTTEKKKDAAFIQLTNKLYAARNNRHLMSLLATTMGVHGSDVAEKMKKIIGERVGAAKQQIQDNAARQAECLDMLKGARNDFNEDKGAAEKAASALEVATSSLARASADLDARTARKAEIEAAMQKSANLHAKEAAASKTELNNINISLSMLTKANQILKKAGVHVQAIADMGKDLRADAANADKDMAVKTAIYNTEKANNHKQVETATGAIANLQQVIGDSENAKAESTEQVETTNGALSSSKSVLGNYRKECKDFSDAKAFNEQQTELSNSIESLNSAKAIFSGANFGL